MALHDSSNDSQDSPPIERLDARRFKIEELLEKVREGRIRIPRFQRGLRWTGSDVEKLFDSIYRGFPIGTLLFWQRPAPADRVSIGPVEIDAPQTTDALWVVDGQQRVTSLAAALLPLNADTTDPRFDLAFDLVKETFVRHRRSIEPETWLPLRSAYDLQKVLPWLRERQLPQHLEDRAYKLADALRNYEVPSYVVKASNEQALRQIFDRTNTFGKRMTRAEVFHALNTSTESKPADLRALSEDVASEGFGELDDNTLLFCVLGVRDSDVLRDFHSEFEDSDDLVQTFSTARRAIADATSFLVKVAGVPHLELVPYQHLTVGLVRYFALHRKQSDWDQTLLRRWFWRSAVHGPIARLGSTGTLRATTKAITPGDPHSSVQALLDLVASERRVPDLTLFRWNVADVRTSVCALANLSPVDLLSNQTIPVTETIEDLGREALSLICPPGVNDLARTLAARVFSSSDDGPPSPDELAAATAIATEEVLGTHAISPAAAEALRGGRLPDFLKSRAVSLGAVVAAFVDARAEWERSARPSIAELRPVGRDES